MDEVADDPYKYGYDDVIDIKLGCMGVEIVTKEDLQALRVQLLNDIATLLAAHAVQPSKQNIEGFKTKDVRRILGCSVNKLVSLRQARRIRWKKVGGTVYYNKDDVRRLMEEGF